MTRDELEALWSAPENWKWGIYYCKDDPRAIVPKRAKWMGWTINFARPSAVPTLLLLLVLLGTPIFGATAMHANNSVILGVGVAATALLCSVCGYLSSQTG